MKIVYCTGSLTQAGGAERVLISKANWLAETGRYDVYIITAAQRGKDPVFKISSKVKMIDAAVNQFFSSPVIPIISKKIALPKIKAHYKKILENIDPDIVIVNELGYDDEVIPNLNLRANTIREFHLSHEAVKIKISAMRGRTRYSTQKINEISFRQFNKFDCVVFLTDEDRNERRYNTRTFTIPNIIPQLPSESSPLNQKIAITVGRLDEFKNQAAQIAVWKEIVKTNPDWQLQIFGEGPMKASLQSQINDLGLQNSVFLMGVDTNITQRYLNASLFLFTSKAEGFGMVLVEAMAAGLPCVSYDIPCGPSTIISKETGFLITNNNHIEFTNAVQTLIRDEALRKKMGQNARLNAANYLPDAVMPMWEELFERLVK